MNHTVRYRSQLAALLLVWSVPEDIISKEKHHHPEPNGVTAIDVYGESESLHLLEARSSNESGDRSELWYHSSVDGGKTWKEAIRIDENLPPAFSPRRGMDPQIASSNGQLIAVWTIAGTDQWGSGPLTTAVSDDGGLTWESGPNPADSGLTSGHGFIDITADDKGIFHLVWLDKRDGSQGLRYSKSRDKGMTWTENITLDRETCECCSNRIISGPGGKIVVLYRGKNPRDMRVIISTDAGETWDTSMIAGNFDWQFDGCPHVGGGLALAPPDAPERVHLLVWTGEVSSPGVHYTGVNRSSEKQYPSKQISSASGLYPDLCADKEGNLAAVWRDPESETGPLLFSISTDQGISWTENRALQNTDASATHPLLVCSPSGLRVFWTESPKSSISVWKSALLEVD